MEMIYVAAAIMMGLVTLLMSVSTKTPNGGESPTMHQNKIRQRYRRVIPKYLQEAIPEHLQARQAPRIRLKLRIPSKQQMKE